MLDKLKLLILSYNSQFGNVHDVLQDVATVSAINGVQRRVKEATLPFLH